MKGFKESTKLQWSGYVDLADGALEKQYKAYKECLEVTKAIGLWRENAAQDMATALSSLNKDLEFRYTLFLAYWLTLKSTGFLELIKSNDSYSQKVASPNHNEKEMIILAWRIKELIELNEVSRRFFNETKLFGDKCKIKA